MIRLLDLFAGRLGWSKAFLERGWDVVAIDLVLPSIEIPAGVDYRLMDILTLTPDMVREIAPDFICASSPCEQFSVHGLKCFFKDPPYPEFGIRLFNHTRALCEASGLPYVMENVRAAEPFVGRAANHVGPFFLWGNAIPPILPQGIKKEFRGASGTYMKQCPADVSQKEWRNRWQAKFEREAGSRKACAGLAATIPPELSSCVADYAERLLEQRMSA